MKRLFSIAPVFLIVILLFKNWFISEAIIGGDWPYFFNETLKDFTFFPPSWSMLHGGGLGGVIPGYFLDQYLFFTVSFFVHLLHVPWPIVYKIFWFGLFLFLSFFSSVYLFKKVFYSSLPEMVIAGSMYTMNTYILMVVGGGQMGIALAYGIAPFVFAKYIELIGFLQDKKSSLLKHSLVLGLLLAAQVMFDPRYAYMVMLITIFYYSIFLVLHLKLKSVLPFLLYAITIPLLLAVFIHAQWLLPLIVYKTSPVPEGILSAEGFRFFSFADFSHTFSLLHPNWPENIFGKIYFLQPEFLILPILAYASLFFLSTKKNEERSIARLSVLFLSLIGLCGTFLSKGSNPPLEGINEWLFIYIPGMNLFRDPTKFYLLTCLSYSMLTPFSVFRIRDLMRDFRWNRSIQVSFLVTVSFFLLFLLRQALWGELTGTFQQRAIPKEYEELKDFLIEQPDFFRTLWTPKQSRFAFVSNRHPAVEATPLFQATNAATMLPIFRNPESKKYLSEIGIKYVIIPYDSLGEIFLDDRKYSKKERVEIEKGLDQIEYLRKVKSGNIVVYETSEHKDHFWLEQEGTISYKMNNPSEYTVSVETATPNTLIFAENFDINWIAKTVDKNVTSVRTNTSLNSFVIQPGKYTLGIFYKPQEYYLYGRTIAITSLVLALLAIVMLKSKNYAS